MADELLQEFKLLLQKTMFLQSRIFMGFGVFYVLEKWKKSEN